MALGISIQLTFKQAVGYIGVCPGSQIFFLNDISLCGFDRTGNSKPSLGNVLASPEYPFVFLMFCLSLPIFCLSSHEISDFSLVSLFHVTQMLSGVSDFCLFSKGKSI